MFYNFHRTEMCYSRRLKLRCNERSDVRRVRPIFVSRPRYGFARQVRELLEDRVRDVIAGWRF